ALRYGAPTQPTLAGAIAGLAAGGIAATFYALNCNNDSPLFVATWYPIAIGIVVLAGATIGSRLLRW
ncbi:MAG: NrsF family protein, partial [Xanthobacteraceae bacterium]